MPTKDQEESAIIETDFTELNDGTLLEVVEHPDRPGKRRLAVWKSGDTQFCESYERNGHTYVPPTTDGRILESIRLPRGVEAFKSVYDLQERVESLIRKC